MKIFWKNAALGLLFFSYLAALWGLIGVVMYFNVTQGYKVLAGIGVFVLAIVGFAGITTWTEMPPKSSEHKS